MAYQPDRFDEVPEYTDQRGAHRESFAAAGATATGGGRRLSPLLWVAGLVLLAGLFVGVVLPWLTGDRSEPVAAESSTTAPAVEPSPSTSTSASSESSSASSASASTASATESATPSEDAAEASRSAAAAESSRAAQEAAAAEAAESSRAAAEAAEAAESSRAAAAAQAAEASRSEAAAQSAEASRSAAAVQAAAVATSSPAGNRPRNGDSRTGGSLREAHAPRNRRSGCRTTVKMRKSSGTGPPNTRSSICASVQCWFARASGCERGSRRSPAPRVRPSRA